MTTTLALLPLLLVLGLLASGRASALVAGLAGLSATLAASAVIVTQQQGGGALAGLFLRETSVENRTASMPSLRPPTARRWRRTVPKPVTWTVIEAVRSTALAAAGSELAGADLLRRAEALASASAALPATMR